MSEDSTEPTTDASADDEQLSPAEQQRRKFRAALDAKQRAHHGGSDNAGPIQHAHTAPAVNKRVHRRKSG